MVSIFRDGQTGRRANAADRGDRGARVATLQCLPATTPMIEDSRSHGDGQTVLITGATGYIGGRLLPRLEEAGHAIRCLSRNPEYLQPRLGPLTVARRGDVLDAESLRPALEGVQVAYYLVHSMAAGDRFSDLDAEAAHTFGNVAKEQGVGRIIYLGALGAGKSLSPHLESRQEVGRILRASGVPTLEFRASIILGSASASFEIVRTLVERLPVMVTPRWTRTLAQPIAVEDVISYLVAGLDRHRMESQVIEIGGADRVSYLGLLREYARIRGARRIILPVPCLTPRLSSLWLGLVTPIYARVGRSLIEGVRNETLVRDDVALRDFDIRPISAAAALERALKNEDQEFAQTRWSDAYPVVRGDAKWGGIRFSQRVVDSRTVPVAVPAERVFPVVEAIGGDTGWYYANWLWRMRGFLDLLVGGVGLRRGRRDPIRLRKGDAVDFWRVELLEPGRRLRLRAEMILPGRAWLEFEVEPEGGCCRLRQTAEFDPLGWLGHLYWYALYPLHGLIFGNMLKRIGRAAELRGPET